MFNDFRSFDIIFALDEKRRSRLRNYFFNFTKEET